MRLRERHITGLTVLSATVLVVSAVLAAQARCRAPAWYRTH
jgi:hypothetical protein